MLKSTVTRLFALFIALTLSVAHGQELDLSIFKLTFSDEFDGDKLDSTKWQAPEMPLSQKLLCSHGRPVIPPPSISS